MGKGNCLRFGRFFRVKTFPTNLILKVLFSTFFYFHATLLFHFRYTNRSLTKITLFLKDLELIQACKRNDYNAQMQVYNLCKKQLYNACWRIFKNRQDAEDAVHDTFIKGFKKIHQLRDDAQLIGWFKRIAINHSLDIIRKRKNIWTEDVELVDMEEEEEFDEVDEISIATIKESIAQLSEKYSIILTLYLIEDYNHREISEMLQLKESTVRNQFRRGKAKLLGHLQKTINI